MSKSEPEKCDQVGPASGVGWIDLNGTMTEVIIGTEYDDTLFVRLVAEVEALGGSITEEEWILAGSQEVIFFRIALPAGNMEAVFETYIGWSLRGTTALVE